MGSGTQSKRTKKFNSTGGVKGRLRKGTITSKGSFKRKNSKNNGGLSAKEKEDAKRARMDNASAQYTAEREQKREEADLVSKKNLGELDMESFFETFADDDDDDDVDDVDDVEEKMMVDDDGDEDINDANAQGSSDSDSEDEDIEEAERKMKEEMAKLQNKDPEFHQFLRENEDSLLDYGDDDDIQVDDDDDDEDPEQTKKKKKSDDDDDDSSVRLTAALLAKYEKGAFKSHGVKALKKLVNAYKSACHMTDEEKQKDGKGGQNYKIDSSDVFDRLMVVSLTKCKDEFHYHLLGDGSGKKEEDAKIQTKNSKKKQEDDEDDSSMDDEDEDDDIFDPDKPINPKVLERGDRWNDFNPILFTFFKATTNILSEAKESQLVVFVLKALFEYIPYMTPYPRLAETMLKILTSLWSAPIDSSEDYQVVRLHAFLRIRQLAMTQPFPFIEECLKKLYLAYAQRAKFATPSSVTSALPTLTFMGNCVVELYSLDYHSSYQHAFIYIRQLALHLRTAMQKKTPEAMGAVYCWQFLHCLKLWVAVLTEACQSDDDLEGFSNFASSSSENQLLRSLIFPLTQVILGTARLIPSTRYLPLRLHCVRLLQQLAAAAEIFLPTTPILMDVFDLHELSQAPKKVHKSNIQPMALTLRLRADNPLRSMEEMEMCLSEVFVLLNREVDLYRYSAGFPEFSTRIVQRLRKYSKETRNGRWRAYAKGCMEVCDRYSAQVMNDRANSTILMDVAPKDVKQLEVLRPHSTPSMGQRYKQSLEKEKRLEAANKPVQSKKTSDPKSSKEEADASNNDDETKETKASKKKRKKNNKRGRSEVDELLAQGKTSLEQADEVEEGINWSDDEE